MPEPSDIELFEIELDMLEPPNEQGLLTSPEAIAVLGLTPHGPMLRLGIEVPDHVRQALTDLTAPMNGVDADVGPVVTMLARAAGRITIGHGPHYVLPPDTTVESTASIVRSDDANAQDVHAHNPGNWDAGEWDDLVSGTLGPWAMAMEGRRILSISHTPRPMTDLAAEVGVWTHPDARGRGLAAATTAAWVGVVAPSGRHLFYSTSARNHASQSVAAKLGARLIASKWSFAGASAGPSPYKWAPS